MNNQTAAAAEIKAKIEALLVSIEWAETQTEYAWSDDDRKERVRALRGYLAKLNHDYCEATPEDRCWSNM